jgi:hypothetical protein
LGLSQSGADNLGCNGVDHAVEIDGNYLRRGLGGAREEREPNRN